MPHFGEKSTERIMTCHTDLRLVMYEAIKIYDFSVLKGHRPEHEQNAAYASGASELEWPFSKHNLIPSEAIDIAPYPIDWENLHRFKTLAEIVKDCAKGLEIEIAWGWDLWNWDMPHWQLTRQR